MTARPAIKAPPWTQFSFLKSCMTLTWQPCGHSLSIYGPLLASHRRANELQDRRAQLGVLSPDARVWREVIVTGEGDRADYSKLVNPLERSTGNRLPSQAVGQGTLRSK